LRRQLDILQEMTLEPRGQKGVRHSDPQVPVREGKVRGVLKPDSILVPADSLRKSLGDGTRVGLRYSATLIRDYAMHRDLPNTTDIYISIVAAPNESDARPYRTETPRELLFSETLANQPGFG
jgi:hypothetical protein